MFDKRHHIKRTVGEQVFDGVNVLLLAALGFATLYPFYYVAIVSISGGQYVIQGAVRWVPLGINFKSYEILMDYPALWQSYANTLLYVSVGTAVNLLMTGLCAFPLSKKRFFGRGLFTFIIVFTMFFNGGLIPRFIVVRNLGMLNTMWAIVLPTAIHTFYMIIMRTFFQSIPESLSESAYMDGANDIVILLRIVIPISVPIIATLTLFYAVARWNSFLPALIYLRSASKYPLQVFLRNMVVQGSMGDVSNDLGAATDFLAIDTTVKYSAIMYSTLPILLLYPFLQKYFVKGLMIGSLKG
jgi:putative aldouronate transport system permease protein